MNHKPLRCHVGFHLWDYSPAGTVWYCIRNGCDARQVKTGHLWITVALLVLALGLCKARAVEPTMSARINAVMQAQLKPPPCAVSINLTDTLGRPYCFICKPDSAPVRIMLTRTRLSEKEIREIADWINKFKAPLPMKE